MTAVSHVLTEALNNARKHAPGAAVAVTLAADDAGLCLTVRDDGPGPADAAAAGYSALLRGGHLGLLGMHDWARSVGGTLRLERGEPAGAVVTLHCPWPRA